MQQRTTTFFCASCEQRPHDCDLQLDEEASVAAELCRAEAGVEDIENDSGLCHWRYLRKLAYREDFKKLGDLVSTKESATHTPIGSRGEREGI